jgi:hypothetical protein
MQMLTAVLIIVAACALRAADKISAEAIVSIFSGIAGYVWAELPKLTKTLRPSRHNQTETLPAFHIRPAPDTHL